MRRYAGREAVEAKAACELAVPITRGLERALSRSEAIKEDKVVIAPVKVQRLHANVCCALERASGIPHRRGGRVGHQKGDPGLSMTSRYSGRETPEAKPACVRAVRFLQ
jgi:hypothetical protein